MKEIAKLLQIYKSFCLIPEAKLVAALKIDLRTVPILRVILMPKPRWSAFPEDAKSYICLAKGENIVTLAIRDEAAPEITLGDCDHYYPFWTPRKERDDLPVLLTEHLEDIRSFLMNGRLKDESRYVCVSGDPPNPYWGRLLYYELEHAVTPC